MPKVYVLLEMGGGWDNPDWGVALVTTSEALAKDAQTKLCRDVGGWGIAPVIVEVDLASDWNELDTAIESYLQGDPIT